VKESNFLLFPDTITLVTKSHILYNALFDFQKISEPLHDYPKSNNISIVIFHSRRLSMMKPNVGLQCVHIWSWVRYKTFDERKINGKFLKKEAKSKNTMLVHLFHSILFDGQICCIYISYLLNNWAAVSQCNLEKSLIK